MSYKKYILFGTLISFQAISLTQEEQRHHEVSEQQANEEELSASPEKIETEPTLEEKYQKLREKIDSATREAEELAAPWNQKLENIYEEQERIAQDFQEAISQIDQNSSSPLNSPLTDWQGTLKIIQHAAKKKSHIPHVYEYIQLEPFHDLVKKIVTVDFSALPQTKYRSTVEWVQNFSDDFAAINNIQSFYGAFIYFLQYKNIDKKIAHPSLQNHFLFEGPYESDEKLLFFQMQQHMYDLPLYYLSCEDLIKAKNGSSVLKEVFKITDKKNRPVLLFINNIEKIGRDSFKHKLKYRSLMNTLIAELKKNECNPHLFVILAADMPYNLNPSLLQQFDGRIFDFFEEN